MFFIRSLDARAASVAHSSLAVPLMQQPSTRGAVSYAAGTVSARGLSTASSNSQQATGDRFPPKSDIPVPGSPEAAAMLVGPIQGLSEKPSAGMVPVALRPTDVFPHRARIDMAGLVHNSVQVCPALGRAGDEARSQTVT